MVRLIRLERDGVRETRKLCARLLGEDANNIVGELLINLQEHGGDKIALLWVRDHKIVVCSGSLFWHHKKIKEAFDNAQNLVGIGQEEENGFPQERGYGFIVVSGFCQGARIALGRVEVMV